jgi:hypothetical protein
MSTVTADLFTDTTPTLPNDFALKALPNPARDTGKALPVYQDFFGNVRSGSIDVGASEGP